MRRKISNQFLANYLIVFLLSLMAAIFAFLLLSFTNDVISKTLVKNRYPAESLMQKDYTKIDATQVIQNCGGVQVINSRYEVVYSEGLNMLGAEKLTVKQFTDFLVQSQSIGLPYHYDILYNEMEQFWLIVTFPTSIRLDFALAYNKEAVSRDKQNVVGAISAVIIFYLLTLAFFAVIFSRITSIRITRPLQKLCEGTSRLREGDYSTRVNLKLKNEFAQLEDTFNEMAERIDTETALRKQSEEDRKKLIMDVSHDLKNPLASITGYTELCLKQAEALGDDQKNYLQIILKNSERADRLLTELFELSKLENPDFKLKLCKTDVCEFLRQSCGELLPDFEQAGFEYDFDIPENEVYALIDPDQMSRVLHNLAQNAIRYNLAGTTVSVSVYEEVEEIWIKFMDNGIGISANVAKDIFKPFVRVDDSRNSQTGGSGLGLSIARRIVEAHGGQLELDTDSNKGCTFTIHINKI